MTFEDLSPLRVWVFVIELKLGFKSPKRDLFSPGCEDWNSSCPPGVGRDSRIGTTGGCVNYEREQTSNAMWARLSRTGESLSEVIIITEKALPPLDCATLSSTNDRPSRRHTTALARQGRSMNISDQLWTTRLVISDLHPSKSHKH